MLMHFRATFSQVSALKTDLFKADFGNEHGHVDIYFDLSKLLLLLLKNVAPRPDI